MGIAATLDIAARRVQIHVDRQACRAACGLQYPGVKAVLFAFIRDACMEQVFAKYSQ